MDFDKLVERRGSHSMKWDLMESRYGVNSDVGLPMWVADMDFQPPACVTDAIHKMTEIGIYGYFGDDKDYLRSICWWMKNRHNWSVQPEWIFSTHGLVNGIGLCVDAFTASGDGVVLFTPVYHAFARTITGAGRKVIECELVNESGRYEVDFDRWEAQMTGAEKMMILCSPHNPSGRVWSREELQGFADFAKRHDLVLVSDDIHHDLVFESAEYIPMPLVDDSIQDRLIMLTAPSKTFNIAGAHTGQVIISDTELRAKFNARMIGLGLSPNAFGQHMTPAAYSPEGALWVDSLVIYLDGNRKLLDEGFNAIPGVTSMKMQSTYLAWVDFSSTGLEPEEFTRRVERDAKIAVNHGSSFGKGGESFLRFNFAMPRSCIEKAVGRMHDAFSDLK
ncbi:MAG: MalY/PatB family protein [Sulfitobacter sp.]